MHEWEARIRHVESNLNQLMELVGRLQDQVGQLNQDRQMSRQPASGAGTKSRSAVVTTEITAASGGTLGQGVATIRLRDGATLSDGPSATIYSNLSVAIPVGTRIEVEPEDDAYKLVASDCVNP